MVIATKKKACMTCWVKVLRQIEKFKEKGK